MRLIAVFLFGISTLGCKDKEAPRPAPRAETPAPVAPQPKVATPEVPKLAPEAEVKIDPAEMEKTIKAVAPQLTDVKCEAVRCGATLSAANDAELTAALGKLESEDSLRQLGEARSILLTGAPVQKDGKVSVKLYVQLR